MKDMPSKRDGAAKIVEHIRSIGIVPGERFTEMARIYGRPETIEPEDPDYPLARDMSRDLEELWNIFEEHEVSRSNVTFCRLVKRLMHDSSRRQLDNGNSIGRDTQFELYLSAICSRAGLKPVRFAEPDVICTIEGREFSIAAKRVKSGNPNSLVKHVNKAASQIMKHGVPGVIALELSASRNPQNVEFNSPCLNQIFEMFVHARLKHHNEKMVELFLSDKYRKLFSKCKVIGILTIDHLLRLNEFRQWSKEGFSQWFSTSEGDPAAEADFETFSTEFPRGFAKLIDL